MKIIKFAFPLAAMICFSAVAPLVVAADSTTRKRSSASARKKSSSAKKSSKSGKSAKARKSKTAKKGKSERSVAKISASEAWIDELPEVELPTQSGPAEEELLEPVVETETIEPEAEEEEPEPQP